jgi:predicted metal-dependent phosphoesterase TrpH
VEAGATREWIRADLHTHTRHSLDAFPAPADLVRRAAEVGLDRVAVTDHGTVRGALEAKELDPERVIVGQEVRCACRTEVIGLFLSRGIPDGLPVEETVDRIRAQGGVVYAPHPFAYLLTPEERARSVLALADVVEVVNARAFLPVWNRRARRAADRRELPGGAGSDAHRLRELGRAHVRLPAFRDAEGFLEAVARAEPEKLATTGPEGHLLSMGWKAARKAAGLLPTPAPVDGERERAPAAG